MKKYCSCGATTEYSLELPKFCSGCGKSFGAIVASPTPPALSPSTPPPEDDDVIIVAPTQKTTKGKRMIIVDEEGERIEVPEKIKLTIELGGMEEGEKLGELMGTATETEIAQFKRKRPKIQGKKQLQELLNEHASCKVTKKVINIGED